MKEKYPCQQLLGGTGASIYMNENGLCDHPECNPENDDRTTGDTEQITSFIEHGLEVGDKITEKRHRNLLMKILVKLAFWYRPVQYKITSIDSETSFTYEVE